jgi:hypothetical protein
MTAADLQKFLMAAVLRDSGTASQRDPRPEAWRDKLSNPLSRAAVNGAPEFIIQIAAWLVPYFAQESTLFGDAGDLICSQQGNPPLMRWRSSG